MHVCTKVELYIRNLYDETLTINYIIMITNLCHLVNLLLVTTENVANDVKSVATVHWKLYIYVHVLVTIF